MLAWALENIGAEVEALLSTGSPSIQSESKSRPPRVRWYQAAQRRRQDDANAADIEEAIGSLVHASEHGDQAVLDAFEQAYQPVLDGMLETLGRLGIQFDRFTKESMFVTNGDVAELMSQLGQLDINGVADNGAVP